MHLQPAGMPCAFQSSRTESHSVDGRLAPDLLSKAAAGAWLNAESSKYVSVPLARHVARKAFFLNQGLLPEVDAEGAKQAIALQA